MRADMDRLLRQDMLSLTPARGSFDVEALAAGIAAIDYSFRDRARPERFVLVGDPGWRDSIAAAREADPGSPLPMVCSVEVRPDELLVWPAAHSPGLADVSRRLLRLLLDTCECHIENDFGTDMLGGGA